AGGIDHAEVVAITSDGKIFAPQKDKGRADYDRVIMWDLAAGRPCGRFATKPAPHLNLALSGDERTAAVWRQAPGSDLEFWEVAPARRVASAQIAFDFPKGFFSPDGTLFALRNRDRLLLVDPTTGREIWHLAHVAEIPDPISFFTSDSRTVVTRTEQ